MSEEMIEKATRAFYEKAAGIGAELSDMNAPPFEKVSAEEREQLAECVAAAIAAYNPNERLREALEEIAKWEGTGTWPAFELVGIAKRALSPLPQGED